jgi:hypothetical protein
MKWTHVVTFLSAKSDAAMTHSNLYEKYSSRIILKPWMANSDYCYLFKTFAVQSENMFSLA